MSLFKLKEVEQLTPLVGEFFHTGSRVICNPPPQDTDDDYIVLVGQGAIQYVQQTLDQTGWKLGGSFDPRTNKLVNSTEFVSYKKDEYNLILTTNQDYFESFKRATYLASHLNLLKKEDRVTLFEAVVRDNYPTKLKSIYKSGKSWTDMFKVPRDFAVDINFAQAEPPVVAPRILNGVAGAPNLLLDMDFNVVEQRGLRVGNPVGEVLLAGNPAGEPDGPNRDDLAEAMAQEEREADELEQLLLEQELDAERHAEFARDLREQEADALRDALRELAAEELEQERELD